MTDRLVGSRGVGCMQKIRKLRDSLVLFPYIATKEEEKRQEFCTAAAREGGGALIQ